MKKLTITIALTTLLSLSVFAHPVDVKTAQKVATTLLNNNGAKSTQLTDLSKAAGFANLYIFTAEQGFVVMSADDCVKPILGYSFENTFVADDMPDNVRGWLQGYSDEIQFAIDNQMRASAETAKQWKDLMDGNTKAGEATPIVGELVQTTWNQSTPFNNLCPTLNNRKTVTGCVATAMAQVMKFWNHPTMGTGSHSYSWNSQTLSADFGSTTYDWDNMKNSYNSSDYSNDEAEAVAKLMYHCGVSLEMKYDYSQQNTSHQGSSASTYNVMSALQTYFGYAPFMQYKTKDDYGDELWIAMLKKELNDGRPMQYRGSDAGGQGGHSFVCDGYDSDDNFHFNWGWGGFCDGYYSLDDMEPGEGGIGAGNGVYTVGQSAIFGIEPISNLPAPILSLTTSNNSITLSWDPVTDAVSYNIYRDDELLATNITETSFTDNTVVSGVYYDYHARSVSENKVSNPSMRITGITVSRDIAPSDLTAEMNGNDVILNWTGYEGNQSIELHYAIGSDNQAWAADDDNSGTYWGQRYPAAFIADFIGMEINKISCCFYFPSNYTMYAFNGELTVSDKLYERSFSKSSQGFEWIDFNFSTPLQIDCSKDLWIVFYNNDSNTPWPALTGYYNGVNASEGKYIAAALEDLPSNWMESDVSWLIRTYLTDGTYTYNLYDNGAPIASSLADTNYTVSNPSSNAVHQYTVTTNYYGGESNTSNTAGIAIGTTSLTSLEIGANDQMTVAEVSTLTVTGTLDNNNPANLIIENGAQLIHSSEGVKATVKKDIAAWTTETPVGGWYFIASPINSTELAPDNVDYMLTDGNETEGSRTYDLYRLEKDNWKNYRKNAFNLSNGVGYLYANESQQTLSFKGEIKPYDTENNTDTISSGWNLIGNPFTCNVVPNMAYHTLNNGTSTNSVNADEGLVAPGMGIAVYSENGGTLSFNLPTEGASVSSNGNLQMTLTQQVTNRNSTNAVTIDNAIVNFNKSEALPKFNLLEANSKLYIPNGDKEYAIVSTEAKGEMPLNFKPTQDGTFTLTVQPESVEMSYLFLIDNMTGTHINLLTTPNYTFEAKTDDYESRFKLLFAAAKEETETFDNESFGFIINGQFQSIIGQGLLQVIDLNGRILKSANEMDCIRLDGLTAGVYVIRFITANSVRTQKIVVE